MKVLCLGLVVFAAHATQLPPQVDKRIYDDDSITNLPAQKSHKASEPVQAKAAVAESSVPGLEELSGLVEGLPVKEHDHQSLESTSKVANPVEEWQTKAKEAWSRNAGSEQVQSRSRAWHSLGPS